MTGIRNTAPSGGQSGATLIEVIVALAVVALTLGVAASGLQLLARSGERGAQIVAAHDALARGLDVLRRDIERLERIVLRRGEGYELAFRGDATGMTFIANEPPFPTEAGLYAIVYAVQQRRDGAALVRSRAPFLGGAADIDRLSTADTVAVIEGPYRLRLMYLDGAQGRAQWVAHWSDPLRLPGLVRLEVAGLADGAPILPPVVFRPRLDAEGGCVKDGGGPCTSGTGGVLRLDDDGSGGGN